MLNKDNIKPSLVEKLNSISSVILLFNVMVFLLVFYRADEMLDLPSLNE